MRGQDDGERPGEVVHGSVKSSSFATCSGRHEGIRAAIFFAASLSPLRARGAWREPIG
jgi:hypothetical protein